MKNILLTGGTGFVGRHVFQNLLKNQINIRLIIRKDKEKFFEDQKSKIELILTDDLFRESPEWWSEQCKGIHTIIHLAWYAEPGKYLQSSKNVDCLIGSLNLAKGALKAGIKRFIGIGTCFEYDLNYKKLSVETPIKPTTPYAATKAGLYNALTHLFPPNSIELSWCRLFYLYGEGEDERRLVPYIHKQLSKGNKVELTSGKQVRDFLDVSNAGQIITQIALGNQLGPINICSGIPVTVKQFAEKIADKYGRRDLLNFGSRPNNLVDPPVVLGIPNYNLD